MTAFTHHESNLGLGAVLSVLGSLWGQRQGQSFPGDACAWFISTSRTTFGTSLDFPNSQKCISGLVLESFSCDGEEAVGEDIRLLFKPECSRAAGAQLPSSDGNHDCAEQISPCLRLFWVSRLGRVRSNYALLPKISPALSNLLASWPSGKASLSLAECLGKKEEEGMCWAGSVSSPLSPQCLSTVGK